MLKKTMIGLATVAGMTIGALGLGTAHADNPESFLLFAPASVPLAASTPTRLVTFVARVPRSSLAPRDAMIDVTSISLGTNFNMEMLVGCSNNTGVSGVKSGSWPLSSADDFILQCPIFSAVTSVQGGLGITN